MASVTLLSVPVLFTVNGQRFKLVLATEGVAWGTADYSCGNSQQLYLNVKLNISSTQRLNIGKMEVKTGFRIVICMMFEKSSKDY